MAAADRQTLHLVEQDPVEDTRLFWEARTGLTVTADEAQEINRNLTRFFDLLSEWDTAAEQADGGTAP